MVPIIRFKNSAYFLDCMGENEDIKEPESIEIKCNAPEFFEIINRHYMGEYNPSSQTPTRFTPTEDAIKKFNLS